jgi:alginate O-acetyltransferase complex protein AlgF
MTRTIHRSNPALRGLLLLSAATFSVAAYAGLYPPAAPPGSAFVRVFNGTPQAKIVAQLGDKSIADTPSMQASSYIFLAPGSYGLKLGGQQKELSLQASRCYTAALQPQGIELFEQECFNSQLKSLVSMFNLLEGSTLSLKTADGATTVIDSVTPHAGGHREVNPLKASLAVYNGDAKLAEAKPVSLERGKAVSLFVTGSAQAPVLVWIGS